MKLLNSTADTSVVTLLDTIVIVISCTCLNEDAAPKWYFGLHMASPRAMQESLSHLFPTVKTHLNICTCLHAPTQYDESLSSVNAESSKTENVLPTILVSIQARQKMGTYKSSIQIFHTNLPLQNNRSIREQFISARLSYFPQRARRMGPNATYFTMPMPTLTSTKQVLPNA